MIEHPMSQFPEYATETAKPPPYDPPAAPRSSGKGCLIGCLIAMLVMVLLCGGISYWAYYQVPLMVATQMRDIIVQGIQESQLPEQDKAEVVRQVDRVVDAYKQGEIKGNDLMRVLQHIAESPVMGSFVLYAAEEKYIGPSGLSAEEKAAAKLTLQRILRGVVEGQIDMEELQPALNIIQEDSPSGEPTLKEKLTDDELKAFIAELQQIADDYAIPEEPYQVRIGEELRKAVDQALGEAAHPMAEDPSTLDR